MKKKRGLIQFELLPDSKRHPEDAALLAIVEQWGQEGQGKIVEHFRRAIQLEAGLESPALYALLKDIASMLKSGAVVLPEKQAEQITSLAAAEKWGVSL